MKERIFRVVVGITIAVFAIGAFAMFSQPSVFAEEQGPPFKCTGAASCSSSPAPTEYRYSCSSDSLNANIIQESRSCQYPATGTPACNPDTGAWDYGPCSVSNTPSCGDWGSGTVVEWGDPYKICRGGTAWSSNRNNFSLQCSAPDYPKPHATLQDKTFSTKGRVKNVIMEQRTLLPQNVLDGNLYKLPINVGWSNVNNVMKEDGSVCRAESYEYRITKDSSKVFSKEILGSANICDSLQSCADAWSAAKNRNDIAAMNRAKAILDTKRGCVTEPAGTDKDGNLLCRPGGPPSATNPTYNFLTGQYDYVHNKQQEITQDIVRSYDEVKGPLACVLDPQENYVVEVRACKNANAQNKNEVCTDWGESVSFSTSPAPELISPYDPDWEGSNPSTIDLSDETQIPIRFQWCNTMQQYVSSFLLQTSASYPPDSPQATKKERSFGRESTGFASIPGSLEELLLSVDVEYFWRLIPCFDGSCDSRRSSHTWSLTPTIDFSQPQLLTPNEITLNMTNSLEWARIPGAEYYLVHIKGPGLNTTKAVQALSFPLSKEFWIPNLQVSSSYTWRVAGCGGSISNNPELCVKEGLEEIAWSQQRTFHTTGDAPEHIELSPLNREEIVAIPTSATWQSKTMSTGVQGAASYYYAITAGQTRISGFSHQPSIALTYAQGMRPATIYQLEVRTCAEEASSLSLGQENTFCGPAKIVEFSTLAQPEPPTITTPGTNAAVRPSIAWNSSFGSNYYAYEVVYKEMIDEPNIQLCSPLIGSVVASNKNNITLGTSYPTNLQCFGSYTIKVLGCIDTDASKTQCIEQGEVASHTFTIGASAAPTGFGGLVPCGRENFNRDTPWDDREPCGIQHIFLGLWTILNFVLWRLTPILLVLGTMATGAVLYFLSYNAPELLARIKSGWKAFGVGVLIMLFSWFLLNLLLGLLGFDVTIFGKWYEVVF